MIYLTLDATSPVPPYVQIVTQVRHGVMLGSLRIGDRLPTVRQVVEAIAINPNTVFKAYRELERQGVVEGRPGRGTYVTGSPTHIDPGEVARLQRLLRRWIASAHGSGLTRESIHGLIATTLREDSVSSASGRTA